MNSVFYIEGKNVDLKSSFHKKIELQSLRKFK